MEAHNVASMRNTKLGSKRAQSAALYEWCVVALGVGCHAEDCVW
jgi:hypothetical protein